MSRPGRAAGTAVAATAAAAAAVAAGAGALSAGARRRWASAPDPTGGRPLDLPAGRESAVATADGTLVWLWEAGDGGGDPVVLVHGWTADRRVWAAVARALLAEGIPVAAYDQRGHGRSGVGSAGFAIGALGDDLACVLETLGATGAVVVGHSMGGMALQALAAGHPDVFDARVGAAVLVSTAASGVMLGGPGAVPARVARWAVSGRVPSRVINSDWLGPPAVRATFGAHPSSAALQASLESLRATPASSRAGFVDGLAALDLDRALVGRRAAVTVMWGSRDLVIPPSRGRAIAASLPAARCEEVPGAGHQLVFEAPETVAAAIVDARRLAAGSRPGGGL